MQLKIISPSRVNMFCGGGALTASVSAVSREAVRPQSSLMSGVTGFSRVPAPVPTFSLLSVSHTGKVRGALLRQREWKGKWCLCSILKIGWSHSPCSSTSPTWTQGLQNPQGSTNHTLRPTIQRFLCCLACGQGSSSLLSTESEFYTPSWHFSLALSV